MDTIFLLSMQKKYNDIVTYSFKLSKNEMAGELTKLKAIPINGTKKANEGNTKSALRFALSLESEEFKRWKKSYLLTTEDEIVKKL